MTIRNSKVDNPCDGCRAGLPLRGLYKDIHYMPDTGQLVMVCRRDKYMEHPIGTDDHAAVEKALRETG